jgi:hypothetical protein
MATLVIDNAVIAQAASPMGMSESGVRAWHASNRASIAAIQSYIATRGVTETTFIEQFAAQPETLDPTLVEQTLEWLGAIGRIVRLEEMVIDVAVMAQAAAVIGITTSALLSWFHANYAAIKAIRFWIQTHGVTEPETIEASAVEGQTLDPTLVEQVLTLLETGGLILRMET